MVQKLGGINQNINGMIHYNIVIYVHCDIIINKKKGKLNVQNLVKRAMGLVLLSTLKVVQWIIDGSEMIQPPN